MKKNEVWIHAKTWKNLENMNERTETQRTTYYMIPFIQNVQNRQSFGDKVLSDFLGGREEGLQNETDQLLIGG